MSWRRISGKPRSSPREDLMDRVSPMGSLLKKKYPGRLRRELAKVMVGMPRSRSSSEAEGAIRAPLSEVAALVR